MVLEQFVNNASSSLNGAINNSTTTIIVASGQGSRFPSSGNFRLLIGTDPNTAEIVLVTARSTDTLTVIRGQEGTTAQSWIDGTTVTHILTKGAIETLRDTLKGNSLNSSLETIGSSQDGYALTWSNSDGYWAARPPAPFAQIINPNVIFKADGYIKLDSGTSVYAKTGSDILTLSSATSGTKLDINSITVGNIYQAGAWAIGSAANNNTSSGAQAGLTGPLINIAATTGGTMTSAANQALLFNISGSVHLQGNTDVRFDVGSGLAGYFDANKTFRIGASATSSTTIFTSTTLPRNQQDALYIYDASNGVNAFFISGLASNRSILSVLNTSSGSTSTIGVRLQAAGASDVSYTNIGGNSNIEHIGSSTSSLVFTGVLGDGTTRTGLGRMYKSGAWTVGDASNQNTSSGAQAGLSGPLLNIGTASGTATTASNQALLYNISGSARLQGNSEVRFEVGTNLAGYFDGNTSLRIGPSATTTSTVFTSGTIPGSNVDTLYSYNAIGNSNWHSVSGNASSRGLIGAYNTASGTTSTIAVRIQACGTSDAATGFPGNGVIEQHGASTSCLLFSKTLGDGTSRATMGRIYQSGAWGIGDASNNNTSSGAQAGLTGALLNISSASGTATTAANQALLYNISGSARLQGNSEVRFEVGTNLAGYFDSNRVLRAGPSASTNISVLGGTNNEPGNGIFCFNSGGFSTVTNATGTSSTEAIVSIFNTAAGNSLTTGLRLIGAGSANGNADWVSNGVIEQVGESLSALVFSSITGAGASRTTTGRIYRSGAWTVGSASNNNSSSGAQAGLTGALLNLSAITGGTLTSTTNQALLYNSAGTAILQGNVGHSFVASTTTIASTSTSKFITNVGRRIATNVKTANYTVTTSDQVILVGALAGSITITLPASPTAGDTYVIKDQGGTAGTFNIIVNGNGSNIDGVSSYTMNLSYESVTLVFGNSTWSII